MEIRKIKWHKLGNLSWRVTGHSQAIRLPKKFNVPTKEVSIRQLGKALIIQPLPKSWRDVFYEIASISGDDILPNRKDLPLQKKDYFE